jgi:hypothetical protein
LLVLATRNATDYHRRNGMLHVRKVATLFLWASCLALLGGSATLAQITIKNPKHLPVPDDKPQVLFRIACQQVAEEFHIVDPAKLQFPVTVVLGEASRYTADEDTQTYTIYMERWDDVHFVSSVVMLAAHRVVTRERYKKMVMEALRRANEVMPVQAADLQKQH